MYNTSLKILLFFGLIGFGLALSGCKAGADYDAEEEITERILSEKEGLYVQSWQGARQFGTSDRDTVGGVSVDSSGDVFDIYVVGHTLGDFDGYSNEGAEDLFLVKYDFTGRKLWESQIGSSSSDIATGLVFNGTGGVYISGRTLGDLAENSNQGNDDIFLMQVSIAGEELWTRLLGSAGDDAAYDLFVTEGEDVYLTGYT
ncbi:MAG: hypothetical protein GY866_41010, partial [Proteobacteria bacterium]|nr:hypothetical protein [Pseudomonadota bacterium]